VRAPGLLPLADFRSSSFILPKKRTDTNSEGGHDGRALEGDSRWSNGEASVEHADVKGDMRKLIGNLEMFGRASDLGNAREPFGRSFVQRWAER
jgi:hypothetical protein